MDNLPLHPQHRRVCLQVGAAIFVLTSREVRPPTVASVILAAAALTFTPTAVRTRDALNGFALGYITRPVCEGVRQR